MNFTLEITRNLYSWRWHINTSEFRIGSGQVFNSAEEALEAGSKKLLELLSENFDFGQGPVPAHQHKNGGGWVADTATVRNSVYVGSNARVYGNAQVLDNAAIFNNARVYGNAIVKENTNIRDNARVFGNACVSGNAEVAEFAHICGDSCLHGQVKICGHVRFCGASFYGANK